jgi:hypothetical protein
MSFYQANSLLKVFSIRKLTALIKFSYLVKYQDSTQKYGVREQKSNKFHPLVVRVAVIAVTIFDTL